MTLTPLGDRAVLAYWPDEAAAVAFAAAVRAADPAWLEDVVPAYASVGVFFDADRATLAEVTGWLTRAATTREWPGRESHSLAVAARQHLIPVCYELAADLPRVAELLRLPPGRVVELHLAAEYTVFAIGFVPGFPYLGYLPEPLRGVPRLASPRRQVEPGSVGVTGMQTAIYPLPRPGGWHLIGRTPVTLVDVADGYFPLRVGDRVRFTRIDDAEFRRLDGERL
jgi:inhibitor of KinA